MYSEDFASAQGAFYARRSDSCCAEFWAPWESVWRLMRPRLHMITLVKGFHDILPDQAPLWEFINRAARETLNRFGFREIISPILEKTELFRRGIGGQTDIVEKEMYSFIDRGGEDLSLRPEATAGILRAVVEHSLLQRESPLKLFTIGPMFRRERPSKGRFRQFFQINAEVVGEDSPYQDAEAIAAAYAIMTALGAQRLMIELNSVGCPSCRANHRALLRAFLSDHIGRLCEDCVRRMESNPLRVFDCKVEGCRTIVKDAPLIADHLDDSCRAHFDQVRNGLELLGVPYRLEPTMVRGLDYYTRTAFEVIHEDLGRSKAVGGGGRYDGLVRELGGPEAPGIGFALGIDRLVMGMNAEDPRFARRLDAFVVLLGERARDVGFQLVHRLRSEGFSVETRYGTKTLKAQMKQADKLGARFVLMLGDDEIALNRVTVRNMATREQRTVPMEKASETLQGDLT
jgi:histidyl-tRNA synthetase